MIEVQDYKHQDLDMVVSVFQRSVRLSASRDYSAAQIDAWAPEPPDLVAWANRLNTGAVFVARHEELISGFIKVADQGHIDLLFVAPEFQGRGVARLLYERVLAWAHAHGLNRLTSDVSITARPFFERSGFRVVKPQDVERRGAVLRNFFMEQDISSARSESAE